MKTITTFNASLLLKLGITITFTLHAILSPMHSIYTNYNFLHCYFVMLHSYNKNTMDAKQNTVTLIILYQCL